MPSIETQNISAAASAQAGQAVEHPAARNPSHNATPQQVAQASQEIVDKTTLSHREDSTRTTQIPKRAEGAFSSQRSKRKPKAAPKEADKEAPHPAPRHHVDVKA